MVVSNQDFQQKSYSLRMMKSSSMFQVETQESSKSTFLLFYPSSLWGRDRFDPTGSLQVLAPKYPLKLGYLGVTHTNLDAKNTMNLL